MPVYVADVAHPVIEQIPSSTPANQRPLVSIGIAAYNRERYIRTCIESVLGQIYRPIEVVVVDDGSTDRTRAIIESYGKDVHAIYHESNLGIASAKNTALRNTSNHARYVGILDSDDAYLPHFVEQCVAFLEHHPGTGLVYTDDVLIDEAGRPLKHRQAVEPWNMENWLRSCNLRGDTWLAYRDLVMQTRLHDERMRFDVDYDLFYQLLQITTFVHLNEVLVSIRSHSNQSTRNALDLAKYHAANLARYGFSSEYAYLRARGHPEWIPGIEEGISLGQRLHNEDMNSRDRSPNKRLF